MNFNENDLLREKKELLYLMILKLARAKVLIKLEFDTEDQVLFVLFSYAHEILVPQKVQLQNQDKIKLDKCYLDIGLKLHRQRDRL